MCSNVTKDKIREEWSSNPPDPMKLGTSESSANSTSTKQASILPGSNGNHGRLPIAGAVNKLPEIKVHTTNPFTVSAPRQSKPFSSDSAKQMQLPEFGFEGSNIGRQLPAEDELSITSSSDITLSSRSGSSAGYEADDERSEKLGVNDEKHRQSRATKK